jgi:hypothetical protein
MDEMVPPGNFVCECCGLWYPLPPPPAGDVETRMHQARTYRVPTRCRRCAPHRGDDADTVIGMANDHAQWYWEEYKRAVAATRQARADVERAEVRASDHRDRMFAAFRSRDHAVRQLRRVGDLHEAVRGGCSCGKKPDCRTAQIVDAPWVQDRLRELERREGRTDDERYDDLLDEDTDIA